jgi:hypothetical protein
MLPYAHPWGWATWDRAWQQFQSDAQPTQTNLSAKHFQRAFDHNGVYLDLPPRKLNSNLSR